MCVRNDPSEIRIVRLTLVKCFPVQLDNNAPATGAPSPGPTFVPPHVPLVKDEDSETNWRYAPACCMLLVSQKEGQTASPTS
eukprot:347883-Pelagomonas_calceolata.AAC.2